MITKDKFSKDSSDTTQTTEETCSKTKQQSTFQRPRTLHVLAVTDPETFAIEDLVELKKRHNMHLTFCDNAYDCLMLSEKHVFDMVIFFDTPETIFPYAEIIRSGKAMQKSQRAVYVSFGHPVAEGVTDVQIDALAHLPLLIQEWPAGGHRH